MPGASAESMSRVFSCALFGRKKPSREDFAHTTIASIYHKEGCQARREEDAAWKYRS